MYVRFVQKKGQNLAFGILIEDERTFKRSLHEGQNARIWYFTTEKIMATFSTSSPRSSSLLKVLLAALKEKEVSFSRQMQNAHVKVGADVAY